MVSVSIAEPSAASTRTSSIAKIPEPTSLRVQSVCELEMSYRANIERNRYINSMGHLTLGFCFPADLVLPLTEKTHDDEDSAFRLADGTTQDLGGKLAQDTGSLTLIE